MQYPLRSHSRAIGLVIAFAVAVGLPAAVRANPEPKGGPSGSPVLPPSDEAVVQLQERAEAAGAVGIYLDQSTDEYVVVGSPEAAAKLANAKLDRDGLRVRIGTRSVAERALRDAEQRLLDFRAESDSAGITYRFGFDDALGKVVVEGNAAAAAFDSILRKYPDLIVYQKGAGFSRTSRGNDGEPHWGGAEIHTTLGNCSSGFTVRKTSNGVNYMVTAGHCGNLNSIVTQPDTGFSFGVVRFKAAFPTNDVELIGDELMSGSIYTGGATGVQSHVIGASNPGLGVSYCYSGVATTETCSHKVTDLDETICFDDGCTQHLVTLTGGVALKGGDSGGPAYLPSGSNSHIRGSIVGCKLIVGTTTCTTTGYIHKWGTTMTLFGVAIVTS